MLIRADSAGGTHAFLDWLTDTTPVVLGRVHPRTTSPTSSRQIPADVWTPAYDADGAIRDGAWVAELTGLLDLTGWPKGMRVIARKERPHPGAQLRLTDVDGHRITAFATNTRDRPTPRSGAAAPSPGPRRGPDPQRQRHRA